MSLGMLRETFSDALMRQRPPLGMVVLAFVPVGALLRVGARGRRIPLLRLDPEEIVQRRTRSTQGIVRRHEVIVHERIHEYPLLHHLAILRVLLAQIPVVVVAHHDAVVLRGQLQDVPVVVADHPLASDVSGGGEHEQSFRLQFGQDVLVADGVVGAGGLLPPLRHEDRDGLVAARLEPVHADLDAAAGEDLLVSMTKKKVSQFSRFI